MIKIQVGDTGTGLSQDLAEKLVQLLVGAPTVLEPDRAWAGIGLALCRDLVHLMGGAIGFETRDGRGSTFWFTVRLAEAPAAAPAVAPAQRLLPILLVATDPEVTCQALVALHGNGHQAELHERGADLLLALQRNRYGLVLVEGHQPDLMATLASWGPVGEVQQTPVIGVPRLADGSLDIERLLRLARGETG